jgi:hypothetical protein
MSTFLRENALFLVVLLGLVLGFVFLRTKSTDLSSVEEFDRWIEGDQPVVVEFFSNT